MNGPTNEDWLEVRAQRQPERTALIARYHCNPDSPPDEWARLQRALADFDEETEEIYEHLIRERYHARPAAGTTWKSSTSAAALNGHSSMETTTRR